MSNCKFLKNDSFFTNSQFEIVGLLCRNTHYTRMFTNNKQTRVLSVCVGVRWKRCVYVCVCSRERESENKGTRTRWLEKGLDSLFELHRESLPIYSIDTKLERIKEQLITIPNTLNNCHKRTLTNKHVVWSVRFIGL